MKNGVLPFIVVVVAALLMGLTTGCAKYEYDLIKPEAHARHIGGKAEEVITIDPLEYHLRTVESRLVMLVYNHTETPAQLLGARSYVVTPSGESKPLRNVTVAPGSFIKLIMPPLSPRAYQTGPSFGVGVGASSGGYRRSGVGVGVGTTVGDDYYVVDYEDGEHYWEWEGQSDVRLNMTYQQGEQTFAHEFVFGRKKM